MPKFVKYFLSISAFVLGLSIGTYLGIEKEINTRINNEKEIVPVQDIVIRNVQGQNSGSEKSEVVETVVEETKLSPYAKMVIEKKFTKCGHTSVEIQDLPIELVNMTESDIKNKYTDWEIRSFSSNEVSLFREIEANCNDHFVLKSKEGFLAVYNKVTDDVLNLKEVMDIDISHLPSEDLLELENGINVYGEDALSMLIEDFSS